MQSTPALLSTALLFGRMMLYSFAFAKFLFTARPTEQARVGYVLQRFL